MRFHALVVVAGLSLCVRVNAAHGSCPNACPADPCPDIEAGDPLVAYPTPPDRKKSMCKEAQNPPGSESWTAEGWAYYLGLSVSPDDIDLRADHWYTQDSQCTCTLSHRGPYEVDGGPILFQWTGGPVDLTRGGEYTLTVRVYNPEPEWYIECGDDELVAPWYIEETSVEFTVTVTEVDVATPQPDTLCQGHTKQMSVTVTPPCPVTWSVRPSDKLGITNNGCVYFKPYGDTIYSDFQATVRATACDCYDEESFTVKGPKRPGTPVPVFPAHANEPFPSSPGWTVDKLCALDSGGQSCNQSTSRTGTFGVRYQSDADECDAKGRARFTVHFQYLAVNAIEKPYGIAVGNAKTATRCRGSIDTDVIFDDGRGVADTSGQSVSLNIEGVPSLGVSLAQQLRNDAYASLSGTSTQETFYNHAPKSTFDYPKDVWIGVCAYADISWAGGWEATSEAFIQAWITAEDVQVEWRPIDPLSCP